MAVITAFGSMDTAVEALKAGAYDFVSKPVDLPKLRDLIQTALQLSSNSDTISTDSEEKESDDDWILGSSSSM